MNDPYQLTLANSDNPAPAPSLLSDFGDVLTVEEAATVLRISRASAYEAARIWRTTRRDGLPVIQIGRRLLVPKAALQSLLASAGDDQVDEMPTPGDA
jgi:hypothetical protein